ncbi:MAG TPA: NUDIX hydrolase [Saprospirales bacterium]|jgi:8-oxo-dGTP pyrophosphatase MutT (NUDIX family)|nr:NUDIX hydrolase [Saprospirales bacterium]
MYKIYINKTLITLKDTLPQRPPKTGELIARYAGKVKHLHNFVDLAEKGGKYTRITLYHEDYEKLRKDFKGLFTIIEAGGGLVTNEFNEILFIFRRGHWDLPKGKLEKYETKKDAALREVEEETGIRNLVLGKKICITNHVYKNKSGKRHIKKSYWYHMTAPKMDLIPQIEEDITEAKWMTMESFNSRERLVYSSIIKVLDKYVRKVSKAAVKAPLLSEMMNKPGE